MVFTISTEKIRDIKEAKRGNDLRMTSFITKNIVKIKKIEKEEGD